MRPTTIRTALSRGRRRLVTAGAAVALALLGASAPAGAQEVEIETDARLEGFATPVKVESDSTALAWLFFLVLCVVGLSPLFKDAKRTHLD